MDRNKTRKKSFVRRRIKALQISPVTGAAQAIALVKRKQNTHKFLLLSFAKSNTSSAAGRLLVILRAGEPPELQKG